MLFFRPSSVIKSERIITVLKYVLHRLRFSVWQFKEKSIWSAIFKIVALSFLYCHTDLLHQFIKDSHDKRYELMLCVVRYALCETKLHYHSKDILTVHRECKWIISYYIKQSVPLSLPEITRITPESLQKPRNSIEISVYNCTYINFPIFQEKFITLKFLIKQQNYSNCI